MLKIKRHSDEIKKKDTSLGPVVETKTQKLASVRVVRPFVQATQNLTR